MVQSGFTSLSVLVSCFQNTTMTSLGTIALLYYPSINCMYVRTYTNYCVHLRMYIHTYVCTLIDWNHTWVSLACVHTYVCTHKIHVRMYVRTYIQKKSIMANSIKTNCYVPNMYKPILKILGFTLVNVRTYLRLYID